MQKYIKKIKVKIVEDFRRVIHSELRELLVDGTYGGISFNAKEETIAMVSILYDMEKKLNKNLSDTMDKKRKHSFTFKYYEAYALKNFLISFQWESLDDFYYYAEQTELIGSLDKQMK